MRFGLAVLRVVVGTLFMGHGLQKLKGWFGGYGLDATGEAFHGMGLRPGKVHATAAGLAETGGGAMLAAGFLTPVGATMVTGTMAVAIHKVHLKNGPWVTAGGYEYNLVLMAAAFALAAAGPGALSLDEALGTERHGAGVALLSLGAGVAGAAATVKLAERVPEDSEATDEGVVEHTANGVSQPATS